MIKWKKERVIKWNDNWKRNYEKEKGWIKGVSIFNIVFGSMLLNKGVKKGVFFKNILVGLFV